MYPISLDVDGVSNKAQLACMLKALRDNGYPDTFTDRYEAFVMNQNASIDKDLTKCKKVLTLGGPQGSLLSPQAWNVYFVPVLQEANKGLCKVVGYADDFSVSIVGPA